MGHQEKRNPIEKYPPQNTPTSWDILTVGAERLDLHYIRHYVADKQSQAMALLMLEAQARTQLWPDEELASSPAEIIDEYRRLSQSLSSVLEIHPEWADRIQRIHRANYSHPILIYKGVIIDGLHRVLHAIIAGEESIQAHVLEELPSAGYVSDVQMEKLRRKQA